MRLHEYEWKWPTETPGHQVRSFGAELGQSCLPTPAKSAAAEKSARDREIRQLKLCLVAPPLLLLLLPLKRQLLL